MFFFSPLEQFEIIPFISLFGDFSITNQFLFLVIIIFIIISVYLALVESSTQTLYIIPSRWQSIFEIIYLTILAMVNDTISGTRKEAFFPLVFTIFMFITLMNVIGLVPYTYTVTSHFIVTLTLSLTIFIGMNIITIRTHGLHSFCLFFPGGTSALLGFLLVPVEIISYVFKPLSLAIRLFCNMMAGHTLLKVFAGFAWSLAGAGGYLVAISLFPIALLIPLFVLELGVALIQAYVFTLLTCIYLNDALNLH